MTVLVQLARKPYTRTRVPASYDPSWLSTELSSVQRGEIPQSVRTAKASEMPHVTDSVVLYDATGGAITVTLPLPGQVKNLVLYLKKIDASINVVTIAGTVDGSVNPTLPVRYNAMTIVSDGVSWYKLASV